MYLITPEEQELLDQLEAAMTDKQKKVVNFLVGKTMGEAKKAGHNGADPKMIRRLVIAKLVEATYEPDDDLA